MSLELHLELNTVDDYLAEMPEVMLRLINHGPGEVLVNSRMLLVPGGSPSRLKEVSFKITGPPGAVNLRRFHVNRRVPDENDFARLLPGEYIFKSYSLKKYFSYNEEGKYNIQAEYQNAAEINIKGHKSWTGELVSNLVSFNMDPSQNKRS